MNQRNVRYTALLFAITFATLIPQVSETQAYALAHGSWFNGRSFVSKTVYVDHGVFVRSRPAKVDSVIDLAGKFIVAPFGEAHNHNIEGARPAVVKSYLDAGIFYVKDPCSFPEAGADAVGKLNIPSSVDAIFAGGCITGPGGHPIGLARRNIARGIWKESDADGRFLHMVADSADLDRRWPGIIAVHPDFIKLMLLYSEEYEKRRNDSAYVNWRGLNPALVPLVVKKAHAAGLRVSAHIESATDFHNALVGGVDEINHTPGFRPERDSVPSYRGDLRRYEISDADARLAAQRGIVVVTTLGESIEYLALGDSSGLNATDRQRVQNLFIANLRTLRSHGVRVVLGSDRFRSNTVSEVMALRTLGVFSESELLGMWSIGTPKAIFPKRRIACFDAGCEASFVALDGNPLTDFSNVSHISTMMKQGLLIH